MAKPKKKAKGGKQAEPIAALYGLDVGTPRGDAVRAVLLENGVRPRTLTPERLGDPVGAVAGMVGMRPARMPYDGEAPDVEFMLLCNITGAKLTAVLDAMRAADCSVALKAQVTQYNRVWPIDKLIREIAREHLAMTQMAQMSVGPDDSSSL